MQILLTDQIRAWDEFTIRHEPVSSLDLMERASRTCVEWLMLNGYRHSAFIIFCGKGNNGGDGLCIARMLVEQGLSVTVCILEFGHLGTPDFQHNLERLHATGVVIRFISSEDTLFPLAPGTVVIDAVVGSGLNRPLEGLAARLVRHINQSGNETIAIDLPSGLFADNSSLHHEVVMARHTLSFQCFKLAFVVPENEKYTGEVHILDIGLHPGFLNDTRLPYQMIGQELVASIIRPRRIFSHKGSYGHGALVCGSAGMMGAAVLAVRAFLRSGAGKLTCHLPSSGYTIMQLAAPEAMVKIEQGKDHLLALSVTDTYSAVGIGPGLGRHDSYIPMLERLFTQMKLPMVVDADALNAISRKKDLLELLAPGSILTPHPREFDRLFGPADNDFDRIFTAIQKAREHRLVIVLKGAFTLVATPGGAGFFNTSGNAGMAKGGTGDVLTGLITGLLTQGYPPEQATVAGVYLHGVAGDLAATKHSMQGMTASDLIDQLGKAFSHILAQPSGNENIE